jgi:hypothetical protein
MAANKNNALVVEARHEVFTGPLPSPEDLQRYKNIAAIIRGIAPIIIAALSNLKRK